MPRAAAPLRLHLAAGAAPAPRAAPGQLEPEILALIRAMAEAHAAADHRSEMARAAQLKRTA